MQIIPEPAIIYDGLIRSIEPCGFLSKSPDGFLVRDGTADAVQAIIDGYEGSPAQLAFLRGQKRDALDAVYAQKFEDGFNYAGSDGVTRPFQIDEQSTAKIDEKSNKALGVIANGETWDTCPYWVASDNSQMPLPTAQDMRAFGSAVDRYVSGLFFVNQTLKRAIENATDVAALDAIDVTLGWP